MTLECFFAQASRNSKHLNVMKSGLQQICIVVATSEFQPRIELPKDFWSGHKWQLKSDTICRRYITQIQRRQSFCCLSMRINVKLNAPEDFVVDGVRLSKQQGKLRNIMACK